jgi:hypothetical protein
MKPNEVYRVAEGTRVREEDFGLLLVSKTTPALALNDDMKAVWELIDGKNNCEQIVSAVKAQYPGSHVESKIAEIFDILVKIGLIQLVKEV